uniref:Uncharacterized protein n=1 Tax=Rhizophora mucronata TaxID=61149 RepID=A0A2P2PMW0_RHIMU
MSDVLLDLRLLLLRIFQRLRN